MIPGAAYPGFNINFPCNIFRQCSKAVTSKISFPLRLILFFLFSFALTACGGEAGGDNPTGSVTIEGTVASGASWASASVNIVGANGKNAAITADVNGKFIYKGKLTFPAMLKATLAGNQLFSIALTSGTTNITTLTTVALQIQAGPGNDLRAIFDDWVDHTPEFTPLGNLQSVAVVNANLFTQMQAAGLDPTAYNFMTEAFTADGTGIDEVLDGLIITFDFPAGIFEISSSADDTPVDFDPDIDTSAIDFGGQNFPPAADAGPNQYVQTGTLVTLDGSGSTDADGDALTFSWSFYSKPVGSSAVLSGVTASGPTFTPDVDGTYVIQLVVNDGTDDSAPDFVTVNAATGNFAPVADAGPDQTVTSGDLVTLDGTGSMDPDGDSLTFGWTFTSKPGGSTAALSGAATSGPTFTPDVDGAYVIQLVVNDGTDDSAPDTVTVTTAANTAPVADAGPDQTVTAGDLVTLDGTGSMDPDGDSLTYDWTFTSKPGGSTAALSGAATSGPTFTPDVDGTYEIQLIVNDGTDDSAPDMVTVTAAPALSGIIPDTGQTDCYDLSGLVIACVATGQDGAYTINAMSFTDNGDGTITDNITGLMWQKCSVGQNNDGTCSGTPTAYSWYKASGTFNATYNPVSTDVCGSLTLGGHTDWRLPTKLELFTILNFGTFNPAIDTTYFPNTESSNEIGEYWSSTVQPGGSSMMEVGFYRGLTMGLPGSSAFYVRCVR
jgi:hypothetical protein